MYMPSDSSSPEEHAAHIFEISGHKVDPEWAADMWPRILQHKWVLSEKIGRDVGMKVACIDFIENIVPDEQVFENTMKIQQLNRMGAQILDQKAWETICESQPPKQIVDKRIVLPLTRADLARKHGVNPPRTIIFFGPPGTGKTHFARAIAARLQWWYVEVSPSTLMDEGEDRMGSKLKQLFETTRDLDELVLFIDEFEEIGGNRDHASRKDRTIINEFLKQVPLFKKANRHNLLVCATNYIRQLDAALIRPGRFDCIIPVGDLDHKSRGLIFRHFLVNTNNGDIDVDRIVSLMSLYTPADIEYLFSKVSHFAFQKEYSEGVDYKITTETFLTMIGEIQPSLSEANIVELEEDSARFTRY
ncbi:MAG: AAA family ATPase [Desulfosarcinaceae bacterium]